MVFGNNHIPAQGFCMAYHTTKQSVLFDNLSKKAVSVKFDDEKLKLSTTLVSCLSDDRQQSKVTHSLEELFQQRLFSIACGYADGNDAARLADDPVMKLLSGRDPLAGQSLASQPTLSRFENAVRPRDLVRLSEAVIARHKRRKKRVRRITIDLDPTDDPTHGAQQLTFFNRFYARLCTPSTGVSAYNRPLAASTVATGGEFPRARC